jgi:hypothetical protein
MIDDKKGVNMTLEEVMRYYKSYYELAKELNITPQAIQYWRKKKHVPWVHQLNLERLSDGVLKADAENMYSIKRNRERINNNNKE